MPGRWGAQNNPRDYEIARNLEPRAKITGLKNSIGDLALESFVAQVFS